MLCSGHCGDFASGRAGPVSRSMFTSEGKTERIGVASTGMQSERTTRLLDFLETSKRVVPLIAQKALTIFFVSEKIQ